MQQTAVLTTYTDWREECPSERLFPLTAAYFSHVRFKPGADHHYCGSVQDAAYTGPAGYASAERHVCSRHCYHDPALSHLADRIKASCGYGCKFTFVTVLSTISSNYGYPAVVGAVLVGGLFEGTLGLMAKYWRKIITPIVAASVVTAIGFSLFTVGARSFGGGYNDDFGSAQNLILGTVTLAVCLLWNIFAKGYLKQLSVLAGLVVGYILAITMGKVDLSMIMSGGIISLPHLMPFKPEFYPGAIISACIIFLVSAAETIGDTSALVAGGLNRKITGEKSQVLWAVTAMVPLFPVSLDVLL